MKVQYQPTPIQGSEVVASVIVDFSCCVIQEGASSKLEATLALKRKILDLQTKLSEARQVVEAKLETFHAHTLPTPGESD